MNQVFTVTEWCEEAKISKPLLYKLWQSEQGPRSIKIGRKRLITESPAEFLARVEAEQKGAA